jgi:serine/threonine protein kinase
VWLAHDEQLDAEVAIKVLAENWAHDDAVRRRFLEEGRFLRRVESEHVVQVHDVGELEDGRPFLVLTYADRGTLADRLKKEPLALGNAVNVVVQVGRGLQALHRRGLLHRDVKPANVLFRSTDEGERAVLSDLGLGKSLDEVSRITMPGGTPSYVAPEQAMGERLDERADQYSLGAVAYAALTGRSPHQVDGLGAAGRVHAPAPPSSLGFDIPDKIDEVIVRALDPDRANRWPDVATFTRELVGALDETTHGFVPQAVAGLATQPVTVDRSAVDSPTERPPSEAPTELPSAEAVTAPVPVGADPEPTAPSDANAPTLLKPGKEAGSDAAPGQVPSPATGSVQASEESSAGVSSAGGVGSAGSYAGVDAAVGAAVGAQPASPAGGASAANVSPAARPASPAGASASAAAPANGSPSIAPLASIAASSDDAAPSTKPTKTGRRRGRWAVAAVLALLLGGAAGFSYQRYVEPRTMGELPAHSTVQRN